MLVESWGEMPKINSIDAALQRTSYVDTQIVKMDSRVPRDIGDTIINALHTSIFNMSLENKIREFVFIAYERGFMDGMGAES